MINQLLSITRTALKYEISKETVEDQKLFFTMLMENGLSGIVLPYLDDTLYSKSFIKYKTQVLYDYMIKDEAQLKEIRRINQLFNSHQIKHIFLKGSRLKRLYKESFMRSMGDIDILVEPNMLKTVEALFMKESIVINSRSRAHDEYITKAGNHVEIHPRLDHDFNDKYTYFKDAFNQSYQVSDCEYGLNHSFELLCLMFHLAKHFESSGVGLRSILDIGVYAKTYEDKFDIDYINQALEDMSMKRFFNNMLYLNNVYFNIDTMIRDKSYQLTDDEEKEITKYIIGSGIHGKGGNFNQMAPRLVNTKNKGKSKMKIMILTVFPSYKDMQTMYPTLIKRGYLLPLYYIKRLFNLTFRRGHESFKKMKQLNVNKKDKTSIEKIFNTLGL